MLSHCPAGSGRPDHRWHQSLLCVCVSLFYFLECVKHGINIYWVSIDLLFSTFRTFSTNFKHPTNVNTDTSDIEIGNAVAHIDRSFRKHSHHRRLIGNPTQQLLRKLLWLNAITQPSGNGRKRRRRKTSLEPGDHLWNKMSKSVFQASHHPSWF